VDDVHKDSVFMAVLDDRKVPSNEKSDNETNRVLEQAQTVSEQEEGVWDFIRESGLIPRSSAPAQTRQRLQNLVLNQMVL
jgi:hypothetical protein